MVTFPVILRQGNVSVHPALLEIAAVSPVGSAAMARAVLLRASAIMEPSVIRSLASACVQRALSALSASRYK